jgi:hypothetical protein
MDLLSEAVPTIETNNKNNENVVLSDANMSDVAPVKRIPRGRPRNFEYKTKKEYHKAYYILHKHKWNMDYQCPSCELVCSYINKSRHEKSSYHLRMVEQKKTASTTNTTQSNE